jgi:Fur family zinc uptake transcriptional regulator
MNTPQKQSGQKQSGFPRARHDHESCFADALAAALRIAKERNLKLTPLRRSVLEIVLASHAPLGAYDILAELSRRDSAARPAPPTVYRALEFLQTHGFVHRIESRNAYAACFAPATKHRNHFLLCTRCGRAAELDDTNLARALARAAANAGFAPAHETVEIAGLCAACAENS